MSDDLESQSEEYAAASRALIDRYAEESVAEIERFAAESRELDKAFLDGTLREWLKKKRDAERKVFDGDSRPAAEPAG